MRCGHELLTTCSIPSPAEAGPVLIYTICKKHLGILQDEGCCEIVSNYTQTLYCEQNLTFRQITPQHGPTKGSEEGIVVKKKKKKIQANAAGAEREIGHPGKGRGQSLSIGTEEISPRTPHHRTRQTNWMHFRDMQQKMIKGMEGLI